MKNSSSSPSSAPPDDAPPLESQIGFWDRWNHEFRAHGVADRFMDRQRAVAVEVASRTNLGRARILDVGCGTGWLGNALLPFGTVTGTDMSPSAIDMGRSQYSDIELICGDFLTLDFRERFDLVVTADVIAHVYDQARFIQRIGELLRPGGILLLMTQNGFVWRRSSNLRPAETGQIRDWPTLRSLRRLLKADFEITTTTTIVPGGDQGLLFWVNNRYVTGFARRLLGRATWSALLERARIGRELVLVARRSSR